MDAGEAALLGMARALPAVWAVPLAFGWPARVAVAAALTGIAWPALAAAPRGNVMTEVLAGLAVGLAASVPFRAAEAAGALIGRSAIKREVALGDAFLLFALALFAGLGGPLMVARAWGESYVVLAPGATLTGGVQVATEAGARLIAIAITLALPALGALLLAELLGALLLKAQPVLVGGAGVRVLVAIVAVAAGMAAIVEVLATGGLGQVGPALLRAARELVP